MKKTILLLTVCSLFICCNRNSEEPPEPPVPPDPPVVPEEPCGCCNVEPIEWSLLFHETVWNCNTMMLTCLWGKEPMDSCQIPDDVLYSLTTKELLEICIQYSDIYQYSIPVAAMPIPYLGCSFYVDEVISKFNGLSELVKREDYLDTLLKRYDDMINNMAAVCNSFSLEERFLLKNIELLISRYQTGGDDAIETYRKILRHLVDGYQAQLKFPEIFHHSIGFSSNSNFIARMFIIDKMSPGTLRSRIESASIAGGWYENIEWYIDTPDMLPCYWDFDTDKYEVLIINELSYELIK